jgi:hypothetical protein
MSTQSSETETRSPVSSSPKSTTDRHLPDVGDGPLNLHEYEAAARAVLPRSVYDYIAGGAGDEVTLRSNRLVGVKEQVPELVRRGRLVVDAGCSSRLGRRCAVRG